MWIKQGSDPAFQVKYKVIHHSKIFNYVGPPSGSWKLPYDEMIKRAEKKVADYNARNKFFAKLQESVEKEGFRNSIIVRAGYMPMPCWKSMSEEFRSPGMENMMFCDQLGGSRLWTAFKLDMSLPCIIRDYKELIDAPPLTTVEEVAACYKDQPEKIIIEKDRFSIHWRTVRI